jgi:hypothetical protein
MSEDQWIDPITKQTLHFNEEGMLVDAEGNGPKIGFVPSDKFSVWVHQQVTRKMLEEGLVETQIPEDGAPIYHTKGAFNSPEKLLVLIQGTGRVRAGMWSTRVCAYSGLSAGSALSGIKEAKARGMEVVVLNPNDERNSMFTKRYKTNIGMVRHTLACFEDLIIPGNANRVFILCHSMGGECAVSVLKKFPEWSISHITAIAMTDARESRVNVDGLKMRQWCLDHNVNWICSSEEANKQLRDGIASKHFSAGTDDHPLSTFKAWTFIWEFFDKRGVNQEKGEPVDIEKYKGTEEITEYVSEEE